MIAEQVARIALNLHFSGAVTVKTIACHTRMVRFPCRLPSYCALEKNPAAFASSRISSDPKAELEKQEHLQHNLCHIFVTSMLTQKHNKSQL